MIMLAIVTKLTNLVSALWVNLPLLIIALFGIGFLIAFHELGHLIFAKLFNVYAPSFSIGFGPQLFKVKLGETTYALSLIPLGGYVELAGSAEMGQGEQQFAQDTSERSFSAKPYWQKLLIMLGGIGFNVLFAYLGFWLLFALGAPCIGTMCEQKPAFIGVVTDQNAAAKAGLQPGDTIIGVDGKKMDTISSVITALKPYINTPVTIEILRNSETLTKEITVDEHEQAPGTPRLGVLWQVEKMSPSSALKAAGEATWALTTQIAGAFKNLAKTREGLAGPVKLFHMVTQFAGMGFKTFLFILVFISLNLAVFNVLPLPIFDGGQVLFYTIEAITGRPLSERTRENIHYYTWITMIILAIYLTLKDLISLRSLL